MKFLMIRRSARLQLVGTGPALAASGPLVSTSSVTLVLVNLGRFGGRLFSAIHHNYWGNETVLFGEHRHYKTGLIRVIFRGRQDLADGSVDRGGSVQKDVLAPNSLDDILAGYDFPAPFDQHNKQFQRNSLKV